MARRRRTTTARQPPAAERRAAQLPPVESRTPATEPGSQNPGSTPQHQAAGTPTSGRLLSGRLLPFLSRLHWRRRLLTGHRAGYRCRHLGRTQRCPPALLKAGAAQHRPPLGRTEWHSRLLPTAGAVGPGLRPDSGAPAPLQLAGFAALWIVVELLVMKEKLFARCENEVLPTIAALQNLVLKFHRPGSSAWPRGHVNFRLLGLREKHLRGPAAGLASRQLQYDVGGVGERRETSRARNSALGSCRCCRTHMVRGPGEIALVLLFPCLLAITFTCERFFHTLALAWLQVEGVTLDFLDDVLLLNLSLETAQSIFERLAFLHSNFCQWTDTSKLPNRVNH